MTDRAAGRRRASKRELRVWAWVAGAAAFLAPLSALGASPKPAEDAAAAGNRPVVIVRKITRRVVVRERPSPAPVRYVVAGPTSSSASSPSAAAGSAVAAGSSNGAGGGSSTTPPTTTTGGS